MNYSKKVQVKLDAIAARTLKIIIDEYDISEAELVRKAFDYYLSCRERHLQNYDIGAVSKDSRDFIRVLDPPYFRRPDSKAKG